jgi:hypothetical protein
VPRRRRPAHQVFVFFPSLALLLNSLWFVLIAPTAIIIHVYTYNYRYIPRSLVSKGGLLYETTLYYS